MADFVAVIRRTVDGLSDNSPDMRAKVYDKARGAVRRQLENMKPRPSDDMIERQMSKLEAAIGEVEAAHGAAEIPDPVAPPVVPPLVVPPPVVPLAVAPPSVAPPSSAPQPFVPEPSSPAPAAVAPEPVEPAREEPEPVAPVVYEAHISKFSFG